MAEPLPSFLDPVPSREPVTQRDTLVLTPVYVRWLDLLRRQALAGGPVGPQGPAGPQGPVGPQGPQGDPGADATLGPTLTTIEALTGALNTMIYFTGTDVAALTALTPYMRTLLDDPDAATARATLGIAAALWPISQTQVTVTATNGASVLTAAGLAPVGSRVLAVTTSITTAFSTANGLSALLLGDTVAVDRWGRQTALTAGAVTSAGDMRSDTMPLVRTAPYAVLVSAEGGAFSTTGSLVLTCTYATVAAP
jgi:hypothetical protein